MRSDEGLLLRRCSDLVLGTSRDSLRDEISEDTLTSEDSGSGANISAANCLVLSVKQGSKLNPKVKYHQLFLLSIIYFHHCIFYINIRHHDDRSRFYGNHTLLPKMYHDNRQALCSPHLAI